MIMVETNSAMADAAERINAWYSKHCVPIVRAIYVKDGQSAESLMADALANLAASDLEEDLQEALRYRLRYMQWQMERICQSKENEASHAEQACVDLESSTDGTIANIMRSNVLMQIRTTCLRDGILPYPAEEFESHFHAVLQEFRSLEFWHYVSTWAFLNRRQDYLGEALEVHTIHADGFMSDFLWQRINLMLLLLKGQAGKTDVIELIKRINNSFQWQNVERVILPACKECGLVDDEVEQRLTAQLDRICSEPPKPPTRERATKSIICR